MWIFFLKNGIAVKFWRMSKKLGFDIAAQLKMLGVWRLMGEGELGALWADGPNWII